ncbi:hypothetical protein [Virgibacillus oceani]|uniref:Uncharacterized protein n=1 Tax=Virgibacillus oceani TaxID=1479511 RepID=A0A917LY10_9BACI|nr:hypothetical protein [Virgibacillus oceani]GGG64564.1 hypothetical protein GCM10011398_05210 [Virgibacillus oceani]
MWRGMKSVMEFDPKDSQQKTESKWLEWNRHKSAVADKAVPNAEQTQAYLRKYDMV